MNAERNGGDRMQGEGSYEVGMIDGGLRTNSENSLLTKRCWLCGCANRGGEA